MSKTFYSSISQSQQFTKSSKMEKKQVQECIPRGRGRGRGIKGRGECDSPKSSPTASRRPAQALYTPGAFNKKRKNTENDLGAVESPNESSGNIRDEAFVPKSFMKTNPLNEQSEICKLQEVHDKSTSRETQKYECEQETNENKNIVEAGKCHQISHSIESGLKVGKESTGISDNTTEQMKTEPTSVQASDCKQSFYDVGEQQMFSRNTMNDKTDNEGNIRTQGTSEQRCDSGKSVIHEHHKQAVENKENFAVSKEKSKVKSTGHQNNKRNCEKEGKIAKEYNENENDMGDNKVTNETALENYNKERVVDSKNDETVQIESMNEHSQECMSYEEDGKNLTNDKCVEDGDSEENIGKQCKSNMPPYENLMVMDEKITLENNASLIDSECNETVETHNMKEVKIESSIVEVFETQDSPEKTLISESQEDVNVENKLKGELEIIMVESNDKTKSKCELQSKSKRKHKKEEKAKKKEEKLNKKQMKTKSGKIVKKNEEKIVSNKNETFDAETKEEKVKEIKNEHVQKEDHDELMIIRECKDTLVKLSVSDHCDGRQDKNGEEIKDKITNDGTEEVDDWEQEWDDDGECLDEDHLAEVIQINSAASVLNRLLNRHFYFVFLNS